MTSSAQQRECQVNQSGSVKLVIRKERMYESTISLQNNRLVKGVPNNFVNPKIRHPSLLEVFTRARVVGWPPVRSFRKNALENVAAGSTRAACAPAKFVKVAVDGAPYLRKVNLRDYAGYDQLLRALQGKFCSHFTIRKFANDEMKLVDAVNGTEYVPTYEDKDGDWMLVGDVPWKLLD
uniref:Auxin-responsive protein n=1 Tax=Aegilops tauschii TaxID=37682 RepID=M8BAA0_AEGTA